MTATSSSGELIESVMPCRYAGSADGSSHPAGRGERMRRGPSRGRCHAEGSGLWRESRVQRTPRRHLNSIAIAAKVRRSGRQASGCSERWGKPLLRTLSRIRRRRGRSACSGHSEERQSTAHRNRHAPEAATGADAAQDFSRSYLVRSTRIGLRVSSWQCTTAEYGPPGGVVISARPSTGTSAFWTPVWNV